MVKTKAPWQYLVEKVEERIDPPFLRKLMGVVRRKLGKEKLQGADQPVNCDCRMTLMVLFKDLYRRSFRSMVNDFDIGFKLSQNAFTENTKRIREVMGVWAKQQLILGDKKDWDNATRNLRQLKGFEKINLWMDSTDMQMAHQEGWTRKSPHFSGKMMKYGQRFQVLQDASQKILAVWGGYSPKFYDAQWVDYMKETVAEKLAGGHVIADCHYSTANKYLKNIGSQEAVKFYTPFPKPRQPKQKKRGKNASVLSSESVGISKLTKKQEEHNEKVKELRGRVEAPFGTMKKKWECLAAAFPENEKQHNFVVYLACAEHNYTLTH